MTCSRMAPKTHWTNVGYGAAKAGMMLDQISPGKAGSIDVWIQAGMDKWHRKQKREEKRVDRLVAKWWKDAGR